LTLEEEKENRTQRLHQHDGEEVSRRILEEDEQR